MKKIQVIDLFNVPYKEMNDRINEVLEQLQRNGKEILNYRVLGDSLNKCAVFVMYDEDVSP